MGHSIYIDMLEMIFTKTDADTAVYYEHGSIESNSSMQKLTELLSGRFHYVLELVLRITHQKEILE